MLFLIGLLSKGRAFSSLKDPRASGPVMLAIDRSLYGTFNLTGRVMTFREFLDACKAATRSEAQFIWIPQDFLHQHGLETDFTLKLFAGNFPLWRPVGAMPGLWQVSSEKAFPRGMADANLSGDRARLSRLLSLAGPDPRLGR